MTPGRPRAESPLFRILLESALIVLSILLALGVNEWRENRRDAERRASALADLRAEIAASREAVERTLPYHREILVNLREFRDGVASGRDEPGATIMDWGPRLAPRAWRRCSAS